MKRIKVIISGKVIGVFFRLFIKENANKLNVKGIAKNTADEKIEAVFEGDEDAIRKLVKKCKKGPKNARIENVNIVEEKFVGEFENFKIVY